MNGYKIIRKYLFNFMWVILVVLLLFLTTGIILVQKYDKEIKELSISRINQLVQTKISVDEIDVSFLRTFPFLSVVFHDVTIWSSDNFDRNEFQDVDAERLFIAEKVFLKFNTIDLIRSKIRIRRIYALNGETNILIDSKGRTNAQVLKPELREQKEREKDRIFELEALRISDFNLSLKNHSKNTYSLSKLDNLLLKGKFSRNEFSVGTHIRFTLNNFTRNGFRYANDYDISLRLIMQVSDKLATIQKGELTLNTMHLATNGSIKMGDKPSLDLMLDSRNVNVATLLSSFPPEWSDKIPFEATGRGDLAVKVKGPITSTKVPEIQAVYVLKLNQIQFRNEEIRDVRLKGKYTNGINQRPSTTEIEIEKYRIRDFNSDFQGFFNIKNLVNPDISMGIEGEVDAERLSNFFIEKEKVGIKGMLYPDLTMKIKAGSFQDIDAEKLTMALISGNIEISDIDLLLPGGRSLKDINGNIGLEGDSWFPELDFKSYEDKLRLKARLDYFLKYLVNENQVLRLSGQISGDKLDLNSLQSEGNRKKSKERNALFFPERIAGVLDFSFDELIARNFLAKEVNGRLVYRRARLDMPDISFLSMGGRVESYGTIFQNESGNFYLKSHSYLDEIDISDLFEDFNNFGQENLRSDHLKGMITGEIDFNAIFDSTLIIKKDKIITEADLIIREGELNDFKPAEKLSGFIGIEELNNIRFSTLKNTIFIKDNKMTIPEMDINSNAFDIKLSGIHNFNGYFDYKLKILLSEILTGRAKVKNEDYYIMEDKRRASLYLTISGNADDYSVKYNRKEALSAIREDLKEEKSNLKNILNEEFGWFGRDEKTMQKGEEEPEFILEWPRDSIKSEPEKRDNMRIRKKKKNTEKEEEEIFELEWEEDDG